MPNAESAPGSAGTMTHGILSASASSQACSPPAPPKATNANSRGYDPREFALVAFGGAGGLHACELADALSIPWVIVPALPGALSAFGILVSDVVKDYSRTVLWRVSEPLPWSQLDKEFLKLRQAAESNFSEEHWN